MPTQKPKTDPTDVALTQKQIAAVLGRGVQWVIAREKEGYLSKNKSRRYPLAASVQGVVRYYKELSDKASKSAAANFATEARTREINLRIAERERQLIPAEEAMSIAAELTTAFVAEVNSIPPRATRDVPLRRQVERACGEALDRIRDQYAARVGDIGDDPPPVNARPRGRPRGLGRKKSGLS